MARLQRRDRLAPAPLLRQQDAELQARLRVLGIERHRPPEQRLDPRADRLAASDAGALPQAHRVVEVRRPRPRAALDEPGQAAGDLAAQRRRRRRTSRRGTRTAADRRARDRRPRQNDVTASSCWPREYCAMPRPMCSRADVGMAADAGREHLGGVVVARAAAAGCCPSRTGAPRWAPCARRADSRRRPRRVAGPLVDVAQQVAELAPVSFAASIRRDLLARVVEPSRSRARRRARS